MARPRADRARLLRLALAVAVLAAGGLALRGYVTDDTFIHLRYARNLVERGELAFNPGETTYGCSSPLWVLGLALLMRLGAPALVAPWLLGALSALLALLILESLLHGLHLKPAWQAAVLLLAAADAWFLRWAWSGMETPLATALPLLLLWPAGRGRTRPRVPPSLWIAWGAAAGLAGLTRPEFLLLGPLALPWIAWRGERPLWRRTVLPSALGAAVVLGPWLLYAWRTFGRLTPQTAAAKSYAATLSPSVIGGSLLRSAAQLGAVQGPLWVAFVVCAVLVVARSRARRGAGHGVPSTAAAPSSDEALGPPVWRERVPRERACLLGIALTWTAVLCAGYAVKQVWVISRYLSPLAPALLLGLAAVADSLAGAPALGAAVGAGEANAAAPGSSRGGVPGGGAAAGRPSRLYPRVAAGILLGGALATFVVNVWLLTARVRPHARELARGIRECLLPTGAWLRANTPPGAVVACIDVGALGWASERRIVDLAGLVSPELLAVGRREGFPAMVASGAWLDVVRPDYLVDRTDGPPRWAGRSAHGITFTLLRTCTIRGLGLSEPQPWTVALYRLTPQ